MVLFNMISELKPGNMHWGLRVRLVRLYSVPMYNDKSKISTLECVFHDRTGDRIHATVKYEQVSTFLSVLKENMLYKIRTFIVAENKMTYKTTTAPYRIFFVPRSNISELKDDSFPTMVYDFIPFQRLAEADSVDETVLIDVIGRLAMRYPPREVEYGGQQTILMEILLEDPEGNTMSCTLWGEYVDYLMNHLANTNEGDSVVIIVQMCRPKKFQRQIRVSNTFNVTKLIINGDTLEINEFRNRFNIQGRVEVPITNIRERRYEPSATLAEELESPKSIFKTIDQLHATEEAGNYWVCARIIQFDCGGQWSYIACNNCSFKMTPTNGLFYCSRCDKEDFTGKHRFKIPVTVADQTGIAMFLLWDRESTDLIGKTANNLKSKVDYEAEANDVPKEILKLVHLKVIFKVKVIQKLGRPKNKEMTYTVLKATADPELLDKYYGGPQESGNSDLFSKLKSADFQPIEDDSDDEVSTPVKKVNAASTSIDKTKLSSVKKRLTDELSACGKDKKMKGVMKEEEEEGEQE
ncbi:replication protein A 70 kDa DNA-binding subunit [Striga asiatica]|uniref:Replication protein A 70 kDa DNA-binding subunit n=1 Tax=Striga asiatica TaxID=4170 RepID=A0A5A7Q5L0_STRAF|nr:replication protein A 70 kDa DNA-binding subunit [Striga asiatica]